MKFPNLKCLLGQHDKAYWSDSKCEKENVFSGIFRPWHCKRDGCSAHGQAFKLPKFDLTDLPSPSMGVRSSSIVTAIELNHNLRRTLDNMQKVVEPFDDKNGQLIDLIGHAQSLVIELSRQLEPTK